ncbi:hypothetical protein [Planosporangium mesophilum]|nr:hypothetical protein [Planosporangium mesophilum]NJC85703.1 hypothetical protein [Planosporangium mesophilum]
MPLSSILGATAFTATAEVSTGRCDRRLARLDIQDAIASAAAPRVRACCVTCPDEIFGKCMVGTELSF